MILRFILFALMAIGIVGFTGVAWMASHPVNEATAAAVPLVPAAKIKVVTINRVVRAGVLLKSDDIGGREIASDQLGTGYAEDTPEARRALIGAMARHPMMPGDPILPLDVARPKDSGFLASVVAPGMRAVTVGVDAVTGTAGLIWPGDHVDVLLLQTNDDQTKPIGRRIVSETILRAARVVAIWRLIHARPNGSRWRHGSANCHSLCWRPNRSPWMPPPRQPRQSRFMPGRYRAPSPRKPSPNR